MILMGSNPDRQEDPPQTLLRTVYQSKDQTICKSSETDTTGAEPGQNQVRVCRSFHRASNPQMSDHFSLSPLQGFSRSSVFLPAETVRPSLRSSAASRWRSARRAAATTPEPGGVFTGKQTVYPGQARCGMSVSALGGLIPGQGSSRCPLDLQRDAAAVISQPRPSVTAPTNHSPAAEPSRAVIGPPGCQSPQLLSAT